MELFMAYFCKPSIFFNPGRFQWHIGRKENFWTLKRILIILLRDNGFFVLRMIHNKQRVRSTILPHVAKSPELSHLDHHLFHSAHFLTEQLLEKKSEKSCRKRQRNLQRISRNKIRFILS